MQHIPVVEGRRVITNLGVKAPVVNDLERALKRSGVKFRVEDHHHPAHWARHEGRVVAEWTGRKRGAHKKSSTENGGPRVSGMYDLHTHSILSDGEMLPIELIRRMAVLGYTTVAITDHVDPSNTLSGH